MSSFFFWHILDTSTMFANSAWQITGEGKSPAIENTVILELHVSDDKSCCTVSLEAFLFSARAPSEFAQTTRCQIDPLDLDVDTPPEYRMRKSILSFRNQVPKICLLFDLSQFWPTCCGACPCMSYIHSAVWLKTVFFLSKEVAKRGWRSVQIHRFVLGYGFSSHINMIQQRIRIIKIDFIFAILPHGSHRANVDHVDSRK